MNDYKQYTNNLFKSHTKKKTATLKLELYKNTF